MMQPIMSGLSRINNDMSFFKQLIHFSPQNCIISLKSLFTLKHGTALCEGLFGTCRISLGTNMFQIE